MAPAIKQIKYQSHQLVILKVCHGLSSTSSFRKKNLKPLI